SQFRVGQVRFAQVRAVQVHVIQVWDNGVLAPPLVPGVYALLEHRDVLVVRHGSTPAWVQPHSSSASRFTAGASGFLNFSQSFDRVAPEPLRPVALTPHLAGVPEYALAIVSEVLVQTQSRKAPTQQARERRLARLQRLPPQVLAIQLEEVEGV